MTNEEAAKIIDNYEANGCGYCHQGGTEVEEAFRVAVEAIEKQIPKKPNLWGDGYFDGEPVFDMWDCPRCGSTYEVDGEEHDYCPHCGQHIDWRTEEE